LETCRVRFGYCSNPALPPGFEYCAAIDGATQAAFLTQAFQLVRDLDYVARMMQWNLNMQVAVPQSDEKWGPSYGDTLARSRQGKVPSAEVHAM
jgi:hypothetical protein